MISTIYVEEPIAEHPRTRALLARFAGATIVPCERYTAVFNRKAQNFRLQKQRPSLILAYKFDSHVLQAPPDYGVGDGEGYYFSHMLNCLYDCRYCFLQGMYRSAHYVLFVNYEDFSQAIEARIEQAAGRPIWFFSGYDCDSLALEPITRFTEYFLPLFARYSNAWLELRTKSTQVRSLLHRTPIPNCVVAFSFTPQEMTQVLEHKVPSLQRRLSSMAHLAAEGWLVGVRFDPLIYHPEYRSQYRRLFEQVFAVLSVDSIHSVSIGPFRLPKDFFRTMVRLYPQEPLFAGALEEHDGVVGYHRELEAELLEFCQEELARFVPRERVFSCVKPDHDGA